MTLGELYDLLGDVSARHLEYPVRFKVPHGWEGELTVIVRDTDNPAIVEVCAFGAPIDRNSVDSLPAPGLPHYNQARKPR